MSVDIDKAGSDREPGGVQNASCRIVREIAERGNRISGDGDIQPLPGPAQPVIDGSAAQD